MFNATPCKIKGADTLSAHEIYILPIHGPVLAKTMMHTINPITIWTPDKPIILPIYLSVGITIINKIERICF